LRIWNGDTRRLMRMAPLPNKARAVCFSSQGELVAVGLTDGTYMVLHSESLKLLHQVVH
jgi:WD40 repeat protein